MTILLRQQKYEESIEDSTKALTIDANDARALYNRACARVRIGGIDDGLLD